MTQQITGSEGCVVYSVDSYHLRACLSSFIVKPEKKNCYTQAIEQLPTVHNFMVDTSINVKMLKVVISWIEKKERFNPCKMATGRDPAKNPASYRDLAGK